ncbi:MAG TPA: flagellar hook-associated protein FlgK, partial [Alphaproteobacteria bacterium]|nr:flagellar hook-associated protein FlgK [Alphaproteobacteria bacterium]
LDSALAGLRIAQQQLNIISTNVSNVGTPGFTRKILPQSTVAIDGTAVGVRADTLIRKVDMNLSRDLWTQVSGTSALSIKADYMDQIQKFHGAPEKKLSVAAEIARLKDSFTSLSDDPGNGFLLKGAVDEAVKVTDKINDFAALISQMRNDAQSRTSVAVGEVNSTLTLIADLNQQIKSNLRLGKSIAALEDSRDESIKSLSKQLEITFFTRGDGVLVVQTSQGQQLADENAETLYFDPNPVSATSAYPASAAGLYLGGNPADNPTAVDITATNLGGEIGALFELRDSIMPTYQAQLDEMAHKLALRFEAQGLRLFTDSNGIVPANTDPVPSLVTPPGTPVTYVGFSNEIRVNKDILADNSLIRTGTAASDLPVPSGSNQVIRRIVDFAFGTVDYQRAVGTIDVRANGTGATTMQSWLGLYSQNTIKGRLDMSLYSDINALVSAGGNVFTPPAAPVTDQVR